MEALGTGLTTITAISGSSSAQFALEVVAGEVTSITLEPGVVELRVDSTFRFEPILENTFGHELAGGHTITWRVSDSSVASVSDEGLVTGLKPGMTNVYAAVGEVEEYATVNVKLTYGFDFILGTQTGDEPAVLAPRANTVGMLITVGRNEHFDGPINFTIEKDEETLLAWVDPIPNEDGSWDTADVPAGETKAMLRVLARSDAPDAFLHLKVIGRGVGLSDDVLDTVLELTVGIEPQERAPVDDNECRAHWEPMVAGVDGANGWKAISRLKDGVFATFPDDEYKEWMFVLGGSPARERIILFEDHFGAQGRDSSADVSIDYQPGRCTVSLWGHDDRSSAWNLDSYSENPQTHLTELVLGQGGGAELTYSRPVYDLTLVRAQLPELP